MRAAMSGHADCARLLLDAGADKEATCSNVRARAGIRDERWAWGGLYSSWNVVLGSTGMPFAFLSSFFTFDIFITFDVAFFGAPHRSAAATELMW